MLLQLSPLYREASGLELNPMQLGGKVLLTFLSKAMPTALCAYETARLAWLLAGLAVVRSCNLQCTVEAGGGFGVAWLLELHFQSPFLAVAGLLALPLLLNGVRGPGWGLPPNCGSSALSPFAFTPFFAETPTHYLLAAVLLVPELVPCLLLTPHAVLK